MIYVSYNREAVGPVPYLIQKLRQRGVILWVDTEQLIAGLGINEESTPAIERAKAILFCISSGGLTPRQYAELSKAMEVQEKRKAHYIVPVVLPGASPRDIPVPLRTTRHVDFRDNLDAHGKMDMLEKALSGSWPESTSFTSVLESGPIQSTSRPNIKAVSVAIIVSGEILLVQRSASQKSGGRLWQLPGGKIKNDESPSQAAVREIDEEVGVSLPLSALDFVTEVVDSSIQHDSSANITMTLYVARNDNKRTSLAREFETSRWFPISSLFSDDQIVFLGATLKYLKIIRKYLLLTIPLKEICNHLQKFSNTPVPLPERINELSNESTQMLYAVLSLLGFIDDRGQYTASSTLSANILRVLSEWALTNTAIFESESGPDLWQTAEAKGNLRELEMFRAGIFEGHRNILGALSYRLPKAFSARHVCDVIILARSPLTQAIYTLIRWDFLANKFQIPAKGLEELSPGGAHDIQHERSAQYVITQRLSAAAVPLLQYRHVGTLRTTHVGAGALGDGPITRNYVIAVYKASPVPDATSKLVSELNRINEETIALLKKHREIGETTRKALNFFVWAETTLLESRRRSLNGKTMQGYEEIITNFGGDVFGCEDNERLFELTDDNQIPIISQKWIENQEQLDIIEKT